MRISDWSSDVCSSDLGAGRRSDAVLEVMADAAVLRQRRPGGAEFGQVLSRLGLHRLGDDDQGKVAATLPDVGDLPGDRVERIGRSEERRVGKACVRTCRYRWWPDHEKKQKIKK